MLLVYIIDSLFASCFQMLSSSEKKHNLPLSIPIIVTCKDKSVAIATLIIITCKALSGELDDLELADGCAVMHLHIFNH